MSRLILVVPCYNEAGRLPVERFREFVGRHHDTAFLFVNDGSTDATQQVIDGLVAQDGQRFASLALQRNSGKAEAVRQGVLAALRRKPEFVGYWDADLSTPLDEVPRFLACIERMPDRLLVTGARVKMLGRSIHRRPGRHYAGRSFATLVSLLLGIQMYDTQCGAKLFRTDPGIAALFEPPFVSRWLFDLEILLRMRDRSRGARQLDDLVFELQLDQWRDVAGSKVSLAYFAWAFFDLLGLKLRYR